MTHTRRRGAVQAAQQIKVSDTGEDRLINGAALPAPLPACLPLTSSCRPGGRSSVSRGIRSTYTSVSHLERGASGAGFKLSGCSGGAVVDKHGNLVGIHMGIKTDSPRTIASAADAAARSSIAQQDRCCRRVLLSGVRAPVPAVAASRCWPARASRLLQHATAWHSARLLCRR